MPEWDPEARVGSPVLAVRPVGSCHPVLRQPGPDRFAGRTTKNFLLPIDRWRHLSAYSPFTLHVRAAIARRAVTVPDDASRAEVARAVQTAATLLEQHSCAIRRLSGRGPEVVQRRQCRQWIFVARGDGLRHGGMIQP